MALIRRDHSTSLIQGSEEDIKKALKSIGGLGRIDIETEDGTIQTVIRQIEKDWNSQHLVNAVLQEVSDQDEMRMDVSVVAIGMPSIVAEGGATLLHSVDHIKVKGKMSDIPDHLEVDVSHLELGGHVSAHELKLPEGITLISSPEAMLFTVSTIKTASLEPEVPAEPTEGEASGSSDGASEA